MANNSQVPYDRFRENEVVVPIPIPKDSEPQNRNHCPNPDSITLQDVKELKNFQDKYNHANFIRKVYTVVFLQLLNVGSFVMLFLCNDDVNQWILDNPYFILVFGLSAICMYSIHSCCRHYQWVFLNFLCFVLYTVTAGLFLGSLSTIYDVDLISISTGATILLSLALSCYALNTKTDYTVYTTTLFAVSIILLIFSFFAALVYHLVPVLLLLAAVFGDLLFSAYLVHNTQKVSQSQDISAAVLIFVAHINLFIFITITLQLFHST